MGLHAEVVRCNSRGQRPWIAFVILFVESARRATEIFRTGRVATGSQNESAHPLATARSLYQPSASRTTSIWFGSDPSSETAWLQSFVRSRGLVVVRPLARPQGKAQNHNQALLVILNPDRIVLPCQSRALQKLPFRSGFSQWRQRSHRSASPDRNGSLNASLTASGCSHLRG